MSVDFPTPECDQHRPVAGQQGPQFGDAWVGLPGLGAREYDAHVEVLVGGDQLVGAGQVRLGQYQDRIEARLVGGDQAAVDHAGARRRIRQRHDDAHHVRVRDDRLLAALIRRVLEGAAQHRGAFLDGDDARERVGAPRQVAGERTRSPMMTEPRPSSRARTATTRVPSVSRLTW